MISVFSVSRGTICKIHITTLNGNLVDIHCVGNATNQVQFNEFGEYCRLFTDIIGQNFTQVWISNRRSEEIKDYDFATEKILADADYTAKRLIQLQSGKDIPW